MDEDVKQRLLKMLDALEDSVSNGADWTAEQAPLVVQEYLNWTFWNEMFCAGVCLLILVLSAAGAAYVLKRVLRVSSDKDKASSFTMILCVYCIFATFPFAIGTKSVHTAVKVKLAPRVVVLEKVQKLID